MESMITASIGLFVKLGKYYLQIISADRYQFYYCELTREAACFIARQENIEMESIPELPEGVILQTPNIQRAEQQQNLLSESTYSNTVESFERFQQTRKVCSVKEYLQIMEISNGEELYEEVEAILLYHHNMRIFQIKDGKAWEYDSFCATECRYVYFTSREELCENDNLEGLECIMFKDYINFYQYPSNLP